MTNGRILAAFALILLALLMGLGKLMHLRLERGDVYPPNSSFRADPLGSKALAEAMESTGEIDVERNFRAWDQLELEPDSTFYVFKISAHEFYPSEWNKPRVLEFVTSGGRLVFSQNDVSEWTAEEIEALDELEDTETEDEKRERRGIFKRDEPAEETADEEEAASEEEDADKESPLAGTWRLYTKYGKEEVTTARLVHDPADNAPEQIRWHDQYYFDELPDGWEVVYETDNGPVVIRRYYGRGEVVAMTSPYLFTNESLLQHREVRWLSWIHGGSANAIFDEWHFGVAEPRGIAILMRRYQLGGLALGLMVAAGLFVWRNCYALVPVRNAPRAESGTVVRLPGSSQTGLRNLLKRAIAPSDLLSLCVERFYAAYAKQFSGSPRWKNAKSEIEAVVAAQQKLPARSRRPLDAYREISKILVKHHIHLK